MGLTDILNAGNIKKENKENWIDCLMNKEFFYSKIEEIEKSIKLKYGKVVSIEKEAPAEQHRKGLKL